MQRHDSNGSEGGSSLIVMVGAVVVLIAVAVLAALGGYSPVYGASPTLYAKGAAVFKTAGLTIYNEGCLVEGMVTLKSEHRVETKKGVWALTTTTDRVIEGQLFVFASTGRIYHISVTRIEEDGAIEAYTTSRTPLQYTTLLAALAAKGREHARAPPQRAKRPQ